jgi:endonuclease YncB( thermonuclease family)
MHAALVTVALGVAAVIGSALFAGTASAAEADAAGGATALPPPPAFYTAAISRLKVVEPDTFAIARGDLKPVTLRLADATCEGIDNPAREQARALVASLLGPEPFWVFPCGREKDGPETAWRARIWTKKGWLCEVLIKAHMATRRADPYEGAPLPNEKAAVDGAWPPPCAPAFQGRVSQAVDGDSFEVLRDGKTVKVRLFDVACESGAGEDAKALATRLIGSDPVWIFPSSQRRIATTEELPVRIWTKEGWLSQALVKASLAKSFADPDAAGDSTAVATKPVKPDPNPAKDPKPAPAKDPAPTKGSHSGFVDFVWREVPISQVSISDPLQCESATFKITSPVWRVSWNMKPVRDRALILINVYRVDEKWETRNSSTHVATFSGTTGAEYLRSKPGEYWFRVTQSSKLNIRVEIKEYVEKPK